MQAAHEKRGLIIVDHGSRREDSNQMLLEFVDMAAKRLPFQIVEPAHMDLAEPSLSTAFSRCVQRGATLVVVHPYFLLPGRHWEQDIPALVAAAAAKHPHVRYLVTSPLGLHPLLVDIVDQRVRQCLLHALGEQADCDVCAGTDRCQLRSAEPSTE